jgi:Fe-S-cluster containining protein
MPTQKILKNLPELYSSFLPVFFEEQIPTEDLATCDECAICLKEGVSPVPGLTYFSPEVKCCTYYPALPNYLVGAILADQTPDMAAGRRRVKEIMKSRSGVTPHGLLPTREYAKRYKRLKKRGFGRFKSLLCPYYTSEDGRCAIWKYRKSTCTAWFCVYITGQFGHNFWTALREYLAHVEGTLANYALQKLDIPPHRILSYTFASESDPDTSYPFQDKMKELGADAFHEFLWQEWVNREEDFYLRAFQAVSALSRREFDHITGVSHSVLLDQTSAKHREMIHTEVPAILTLNPQLKITRLEDGSYAVYSSITSFVVPEIIHDILMLFDGERTSQDIYAKFEAERGVKVGQDLALALYQSGALVP